MVKIALDAGHGLDTPGKRSPADEREWSFNNTVLLACRAALEEYADVQILRLDDPTGKRDIPLKERADKANQWGADVLVSIHHNAMNGIWHSGGGVETYIFSNASKAPQDIAALIHPGIVSAMGLRNRGIKTANFYMLRESWMPAVLTEGGFMDSTIDIHSLRNDDKLNAQGSVLAEALAKYFGLKRKPGMAHALIKPKEDTELKFSSGTLKREYEMFLKSKTQREIIVKAAVEAGYSGKWIKALAEGKVTDGDLVMLGLGALIRAAK
ncbi:N-acetylmuramoyl-L-alanine amidase [Sporosarcina sp. Te-1]|uniref:N-acetylmuramoyl-L-alanine amidase family protein n=1 Tax=Sporosarcina sp. Te-1 TaxID=2818390 RepID=UPI001A9D3C0D|nr:N-acetylmuramoyl-L-alanine amidase [Sporosarcina sp. Te-1]QTD40661.1 N-acetylmuramoyl-L-alanine amidase [Sporosarcina sp. Te-1]